MRDYKKDFVALLQEMMHDECGGMIVPMIVEGLAEVDTNHSLDLYVMKGIEKNIFGGKGEHGSIRKFETTAGGHVWLYLDDMKVEDIECYNKKGQYTHTVSFKKRGE